MSWLDAVRTALDEAPAPVPVFFRNDDAGWADERLWRLLEEFDRHPVEVDVAVIPTALTPPLVAGLRARARAGGIRLHQHGYAHTNHEPTGRKHEFGPTRPAAAQAADIGHGRELLRDAFGDLVDPVFTPPWNRCVPETADLLVDAGFAVLSRDHTAAVAGRPGLAEVPVNVDWFGHRKGIRWTRAQLGEVLAERVRGGGPVGVMLHHAVTDDADRAAVAELLAVLAGHPAVAFTSITRTRRTPARGVAGARAV